MLYNVCSPTEVMNANEGLAFTSHSTASGTTYAGVGCEGIDMALVGGASPARHLGDVFTSLNSIQNPHKNIVGKCQTAKQRGVLKNSRVTGTLIQLEYPKDQEPHKTSHIINTAAAPNQLLVSLTQERRLSGAPCHTDRAVQNNTGALVASLACQSPSQTPKAVLPLTAQQAVAEPQAPDPSPQG